MNDINYVSFMILDLNHSINLKILDTFKTWIKNNSTKTINVFILFQQTQKDNLPRHKNKCSILFWNNPYRYDK